MLVRSDGLRQILDGWACIWAENQTDTEQEADGYRILQDGRAHDGGNRTTAQPWCGELARKSDTFAAGQTEMEDGFSFAACSSAASRCKTAEIG